MIEPTKRVLRADPETRKHQHHPRGRIVDQRKQPIAALGDLKRHGYRLALDDFRYGPGSEALFRLFDVVKLNMPELGREQFSEQIEHLRSYRGVVLADKLATFSDYWQPRVVGEFNGHDLMVVKVKGEFVWHKHEDTDDFFLVLSG